MFYTNLSYTVLYSLWILVLALYPIHSLDFYNIPLYLYFLFVYVVYGLLTYNSDIKNILYQTPVKYICLLTIWTVFINIFYSVSTEGFSFIYDSIRYLSIVGFSIVTIALFRKKFEEMWFSLVIVSLIGLLFSMCFILLTPFEGREAALFNNVNQLSRYGLVGVVLSGLVLVDNSRNKFSIISFLLLTASVFLLYVIVSRAAILGFLIVSPLLLFLSWKSVLPAIVLGLLIATLYMSLRKTPDYDHSSYITYRYNENGPEDNIWNRGYIRFIKYPKYILLGAGEQKNDRFNDQYEFHSSYGSILWSYGIIGFICLLLYHRYSFSKIDISVFLLLPLIINSLVHNDMRFIYTWILPIVYYFKNGVRNI